MLRRQGRAETVENPPAAPRSWEHQINFNVMDDMRSESDPRPRGRFNGNRPFQQRPPQRNQSLDSNGPNIKIHGSASQIYERYLVLAREAATSDDRIAAENLYQHAEHYFRINNASREGNQQRTPPRPTTPADVEMNSSEADRNEFPLDRAQLQWNGHDHVSSATSMR